MLFTFEVSYKDGVKHFLHTANSWDAAIDEKLEYVKGLVSYPCPLDADSCWQTLTNDHEGEAD